MPGKEETQRAAILHQKQRVRSAPAIAYDGYLSLAKHLVQEKDTITIAKALCGYLQSINKVHKPAKAPKKSKSHDGSNKPNRNKRRRPRHRKN